MNLKLLNKKSNLVKNLVLSHMLSINQNFCSMTSIGFKRNENSKISFIVVCFIYNFLKKAKKYNLYYTIFSENLFKFMFIN